MGLYHLPKRFHPDFIGYRKQPASKVEIDWSNPLTKGLTYCLLPTQGAPVNLVNGVPDTIGGSVEWKGDSYYFPGGSASNVLTVNTPFDKLGDGTKFSFFGVFKEENDTAQNPTFIGRGATGSNDWMFRSANGSSIGFYGNTGQLSVSTGTTPNGVVKSYSFSHGDDFLKVKVFGDGGIQSASDTSGTPSNTSSNAKDLTLGGTDGNSTRVFDGWLYLALGYSRFLSSEEHAALHENPYQIFKPANDLVYFVPDGAGGGGVTVTPAQDAVSITGQTPVISNPVTVSPAQDTISFTGQVATIATPVSVAVPKADIVLTGQAPTISTPVTLSVPKDDLTITGQTPDILTGVAIPIPAGSLTVTGNVSIVSLPVTVEPAQDTVSITGQAPEVQTPQGIVVPSGSLSVTGQTPTISTPVTLSPSNDTVSITGQAPVVAVDNSIQVPAGTLTFTGQAPTLAQPVTLQPAKDDLTLAGQAPVVLLPITAQPANDSISIAGQTPDISAGASVTVSPAHDTLSITGLLPIISIGVVVAPNIQSRKIVFPSASRKVRFANSTRKITS